MGRIEFFSAAYLNNILSSGSIAVAGDAVAYSDSFLLLKSKYFSLEVQFSSDTDVNVRVELEQSNYLPGVQGSYSPNFISAIGAEGTVTDENVHIFPVAPVVSIYGRLKLTGLYSGLQSNSVTTVLTRANWVEVGV